MVQKIEASQKSDIIYPESDGKPMAENTEQFTWIVVIKENLEILFANNAEVFVAGDLLWYPVQGNNKLCQTPDALVVFGRPKGKRGSYKQWEEDNLPPQVVFEVLSPGNTLKEMAKKLQFYDRYGVEEYYLYDPDRIDLNGWQRSDTRLNVIEQMNGWVSPRLGIRFEMTDSGLEIYRPDGRKFLTPVELDQRAQAAEQRVQRLEARLRELGIDPEQV
ncbi:Uma2 family endonuclease [Phormidium sp. CCY1219]|uniref:Uma2 family endonuclease n=1 Tax=Phormidium sp. CCY1219 TaxID=2886104 RepID=UPI002D1F6148|nr:Uma2 family endonuclease [Phormidium sp. CCY1219]MEB3831689.1 Uma2 family endonuclease [Phormidium sp. CCY1219]